MKKIYSFKDNGAKINSSSIELYDIFVSKDGNGDYLTLTEAVNSAKDGDMIFVENGIYDNETVNCFGKKLTIVGRSRENVIIENSYDNYHQVPLNIGKGIVKNLSFKQNGLVEETEIKGYAVHIDNTDLYNNTLYFENCYFYSLSHSAVGVGLYNNCELYFKDCIFRSDCLETPQGEHRGALFMHNCIDSNYAGNNQKMIIDNCKLSTLYGSVLHFEHCLDNTNIAEVIVYNTNLYSDELGSTRPGLITQELNSSATQYNIILSDKSNGNSYPTLNTSQYKVGERVSNIIGKFIGNGIEHELKRLVFTAPVTVGVEGAIGIDGIYDINQVINIGGMLNSSGVYIPINSSGLNVGENITVYYSANSKTIHYRSYANGELTVLFDYI